MVSLNVSYTDGTHSVAFITHEDEDRRQTSVDIHGITEIEADETTFESQGRMVNAVTITARSGDTPIQITFYDSTINDLLDALLAERVGEDLAG